MSGAGAPPHGPAPADPIPIGEVAAPPFVRRPQPQEMFAERAERFAALAAGHDLGPYLSLLAEVARAQHVLAGALPVPEWPPADAMVRAYEFGMPPLDRNRLVPDAAFAAALRRLPDLLDGAAMPEAARAALAGVRDAGDGGRAAMARNLLEDAVPAEAFAEHAFAAAALQVDFARRAERLDAARLRPVTEAAAGTGTLCPACGAPPVASLIVGWEGAHGSRFCACWLCGTLWNHVRIKCTLCGPTGGIAYQALDGGAGTVRAETCDTCRGYVKILSQHTDTALDPVADDVATLGLDLLLRDAGFSRGAFNPFLVGY